jgi:hypothetical protein
LKPKAEEFAGNGGTEMTVKDLLGITTKQERILERLVDTLGNAVLEGLTLEQVSWAIANSYPLLALQKRELPVSEPLAEQGAGN